MANPDPTSWQRTLRRTLGPLTCFLLLVAPTWWATSVATAQVDRDRTLEPTIPTSDRYQEGKVFLEHADRLRYDQQPGDSAEQYQVVKGNVVFRKNDMFMYCDSAYFYESTNSFDAFSNVRMEQGDTLFVYADELNYDGLTELAVLYANVGKKVRLINRDVELETDVFNYDLGQEVGFYEVGGVLTDPQNRLESMQGEYHPDTKFAYFYLDVELTGPNNGDTIRMYTDSLIYNTDTHIAEIIAPTLIVSKDGEIRSTLGTYNTDTSIADLYRRSTVYTRKGNTLTGDTLFYDKERGIGEAFGNVVMTDSANKSSLQGDYGWYNELRDSAFVTGRALAKEYKNASDTLYLHGDTINAYTDWIDSTRITNAFHRVRFYRSDLQGICDSLSAVEADSMLYLYRAPVVWSDERQIFGNVIHVHLTDSTADWARLPESGFMAEHIDEDCFQQISGKDMTAWFNDSTIRRLYVEGNVQLIMFPMENDSTYNKFAYVESSYMDSYYKDNNIESVHFWPAVTGNVTPLYLAKKNSYFLPLFAWYEELRPWNPADVMEIPERMIELIEKAPPVNPRQRKSQTKEEEATPTGAPLPPVPSTPATSVEEAISELDQTEAIPASVSDEASEIPSEEPSNEPIAEDLSEPSEEAIQEESDESK